MVFRIIGFRDRGVGLIERGMIPVHGGNCMLLSSENGSQVYASEEQVARLAVRNDESMKHVTLATRFLETIADLCCVLNFQKKKISNTIFIGDSKTVIDDREKNAGNGFPSVFHGGFSEEEKNCVKKIHAFLCGI